MSKQPPPAPTASTIGPCPTLIQICRTPQHWKFTQHLRTTRPPLGAFVVQSFSHIFFFCSKKWIDFAYSGFEYIISHQSMAYLVNQGHHYFLNHLSLVVQNIISLMIWLFIDLLSLLLCIKSNVLVFLVKIFAEKNVFLHTVHLKI